MDSPLGMYLTFYGIMGCIFIIGLIYCAKQGDLGPRTRHGRRNLFLLVGGLAFYMLLHGLFQFVLS